jgi:LysR family transcriptional regulator, transcriptional activator of the cysJI operon
LKLEQLRSFREAASHGSFSKAAHSLFLTQSAISMQIGALERELGVRLFVRRGRQTALTDAGRVLLAYARQIVDLEEEAQRATGQLREDRVCNLSIGASRTIGYYILPDILRRLKKESPGAQVTLEIGTTAQIATLANSGAVDIGLVERPVVDVGLEQRTFSVEELVLIVPPDHRWARRDSVDPRELETEPFIAREVESHTRTLTEAALARLGIVLQPYLALRSPEGVKAAVRAGLGVSIASANAVRLELGSHLLQAVSLSGLRIERPFSTVRPKISAENGNGPKTVGLLLSMLESPDLAGR